MYSIVFLIALVAFVIGTGIAIWNREIGSLLFIVWAAVFYYLFQGFG